MQANKANAAKFLKALGVRDVTVDRVSNRSIVTHVGSAKQCYQALKQQGLAPRVVNDDKCVFTLRGLGRIILRKQAKKVVLINAH